MSLLLVSTSFIGVSYSIDDMEQSSIQPLYDGNTLYVGGSGPGNYTRIQDAINDSSDGDTVFVYNGTYYENLTVDKSISLLGEDRNITKIDGNLKRDTILITSDGVSISGFTVSNNSWPHWDSAGIRVCSNNNIIYGNIITETENKAIYIVDSSNNSIVENIVRDNLEMGILLTDGTFNNVIIKNIIVDNSYGISINGICNKVINNKIENNGWAGVTISDNNNYVSGNIISNHEHGIKINEGSNNTISGNNVSNHDIGIFIYPGTGNIISGNNILNNDVGIDLYKSSNNTIIENNIVNNRVGLDAAEWLDWETRDNKIYHNNFNNWNYNAYDYFNEWYSTWDDGYPSGGNYWDDYRGFDIDGDGIGGAEKRIGSYIYDRYPLMRPYNYTGPFLIIRIGSGLGLKIKIKNVGKETAYNLSWNISVRGIGKGFVNFHREGSSSKPFEPEDEKKFRLIPFGRATIDIKVNISASNAFEVSKYKSGEIVLCFFILDFW